MIKSNTDNKMLIEIKGTPYVIRSDDLNLIISEKRITGEKSINKGETYYDDQKFYSTMEELFHGLTNLRIRQSQAKTMEELKNDVKNIHDDIIKLFKEVKKK